MTIDTNMIVSVTEANQNFSRVTRIAETNGQAVIFKNNRPKYMLVDLDNTISSIHLRLLVNPLDKLVFWNKNPCADSDVRESFRTNQLVGRRSGDSQHFSYLRRGQRQRQGIIVFEFAFSHFHFLLYCFRAVCSRNHRFLTPSDGRANKKRIPTNTEQESVLIPLRCQLCMRDILICCAGGTMYVVEL